MGNAFGYNIDNAFSRLFYPEITPDPTSEPTFDTHLGFPKERVERSKFT